MLSQTNTKPLNLTSASVSLVGDRQENQDACLLVQTGHLVLAAVADGLGGHEGGALIAQELCHSLEESLANLALPLTKAGISDWLMTVQQHLITTLQHKPGCQDAHTTLALCCLTPQTTAIANLGDSRVYRIDTQGGIWRTRDHSVAQMLVDDGEISDEDMATHPDQSKLFKAISLANPTAPRVSLGKPLQAGEILLLCSDGFWTGLTKEKLNSLLQSEDLPQDLHTLAQAAIFNHKGKSDNVTAIVMRCDTCYEKR